MLKQTKLIIKLHINKNNESKYTQLISEGGRKIPFQILNHSIRYNSLYLGSYTLVRWALFYISYVT